MPLDDEMKSKGMSAVEVIGGRFGKMGGGVINSTLLMLLPTWTLLDLTPILSVVCALIVVLWFYSVYSLGGRYESAMADRRKEAAEADNAKPETA